MRLFERDARHIVALWRNGRNSFEIARMMDLPEQEILNLIRRERGKRLGIAV